jgi:hypothetical protein
MRSLVALKFCTPSDYEVIDMPVPTIKKPGDVLIRLYACGLQTGDTQRARGMTRILPGKMEFPMKIGAEGVSSLARFDLVFRIHLFSFSFFLFSDYLTSLSIYSCP